MATPHPHPHHNHDHLQLSLSSTLLLLIFSLAYAPTAAAAITIQEACKATRYPSACESSLLHQNQKLPNPASASLIINSALSLSSRHLQTAQPMANSILQHFPNHRNRSMAARTCLDLFSMSAFRLKMASSSSLSSRARLRDARAWTGAALTYQYDCWSELSYVNGTRLVDQTMSFLDGTLMPSTSNALSIMFSLDNFGEASAAKWGPPRTERDGFWEPTQSGSGELRFKPNQGVRFGKVGATVCKEGKARGCYATVQQAVDAAPEGLKGRDRFLIYIKAGLYDEIVRVPTEKTNLVFLGDGMGKTVITGSVNTGVLGISTYNTATVGVKGDGFIARGITFQNTAGPSAGQAAHQAVAFRSDSDFSLIENCEFQGNQDTLYAHSLRQVYRSCRIEGNVDFIFGNAAALFQDCTILLRPRQLNPSKGKNDAITAHGRTDPAEPTGLVFIGCLINGTEEYMKLWQANPKVHKTYLGRPWKMYSRTVFIGSTMEKLISPEGWMPFRGDFALSTLYYGEFGNKGPGADLSKRVSWSSQIPQGHLNAYSAENFIQADEWISSL